jgi:hypothetical protein
MSIEQKIAEMLAESNKQQLDEFKVSGKEGGMDTGKDGAQSGDQSVMRTATNTVPNGGETPNPENAKNNVQDEDEAADATSKKANRATANAVAGDAAVVRVGDTAVKGVKEDIDALMNGEELSEEFRAKATTIYEAAVTTRVKEEMTRIEEEFNSKLAEQVETIKEGLVEKVDGYLDYVVEQWIAQNEIALEHGMKSEILEGFVSGLKGLFEEHYIDIPEEKFDVLGSLEEQVAELEAKLNETVESNIELNKTLGELKRAELVQEASSGLADTEVEKLKGLAEELTYEDETTFKTKLQTIRENYFTTKAQSDVKSVVTDAPVDTLTEEKKLDPVMAAYTSVLNRNK